MSFSHESRRIETRRVLILLHWHSSTTAISNWKSDKRGLGREIEHSGYFIICTRSKNKSFYSIKLSLIIVNVCLSNTMISPRKVIRTAQNDKVPKSISDYIFYA